MSAPSILSKVTVIPSEQYYEEAIKKAASYNRKMCHERKMRLPFLDSQTGVAQRHTNLFLPYRYRLPGKDSGQLYCYPSKRWKRKKGCLPFSDLNVSKNGDTETGDSDVHQITTVENPTVKESQEIPEKTVHVSKASSEYRYYYDDWENMSEPPDAGEIEHRDTDSSDFEETYIKKKKKRGKGKGSRGGGKGRTPKEKKDASLTVPKPTYDESKTSYDEDHEKPYSCDICGIRYKTKPGLTYHMTHHHSKGENMDDVPVAMETIPSPIPPREPEPQEPSSAAGPERESHGNGKYCDFCLGDALENKKTGMKEELVSCADCGRAGHPSCLQFTANMMISVKKYPWQCIECKSCGLCGTSENDDQLLFCDDCDRGFHMYCLKPPLSQPPEGNWSCHLCIEEFYGGRKPQGME